MKLAQRIALGYYKTKFQTLALVSPRKAAEEAFKLLCTPYTKRKVYKAPPIFEKAVKLSFSLEANTINGFKWQPESENNGKKILICHGFDSYSYRFDKYVSPLLQLGFEVLAFDAPAHGTSTGKTVNAGEYRDMILKANELYGPVHGMMSHSFGGIAAALAVEKLAGTQPIRLVLIAPATETTRSINTFFTYIPIAKNVRAAFDKLIEEAGSHPASWFSIPRIIQHITTPVLWVHDKSDTITPFEDMQHLVEQDLPHVQFEITEGLGHSNIYKDERVTRRIISFFAALTSEV